MERDLLSPRQLAALLWAGLLGPAAELLPGGAAQAGGAGMIGVILAGGVLLLSGWLFGRFVRGYGDLAEALPGRFGPVWGKGLLLIYIMWCMLLFILRLRQSAGRLLGGGSRDGAVWFFLLILGGMSLWLARGKLAAFGRTGEVFLAALAATGGAVLLLGLFQVRGENLVTPWVWTLPGVGALALPGLQVVGYGIFAAFLVEDRALPARRSWVKGVILGTLALAAAQTVVLGVFGPALTMSFSSPFFQLAKGVGVQGAFQRVESVVGAVWTFGDLILLGGLLWAIRKVGAVLWPNAPGHSVVTIAALGGMTAALAYGEIEGMTGGLLLPMGSAVLGLAVPMLTVRGKKNQKPRG